jgi:catechol 2,3-dioxygenase-like lactoylglutathione lyase family enzyme
MRFNHVTLIVKDLERSKRFYARLGLERIVDAPPRYARFAFPENEATLSVEVTEGAAPPGANQAQLYFECDDLDARVERLKAAGIRLERPPTCRTCGERRDCATPTVMTCASSARERTG